MSELAAAPCPNCAAAAARTAEVERENADLRRKLQERRGGRPPARAGAGDEKTRLVAAACRRQQLNRKELADKLGVHQSRLSPTGKFAEEDRERLMAMLREMAKKRRKP